jgi:hypothetical protein
METGECGGFRIKVIDSDTVVPIAAPTAIQTAALAQSSKKYIGSPANRKTIATDRQVEIKPTTPQGSDHVRISWPKRCYPRERNVPEKTL